METEANVIQDVETIPVERVIEITVQNLLRIRVPLAQMEDIGLPIYQAVNNLKECIRAITDAQKEVPKDDA